ncbi:FecR family protein [Peristeroidobacter soli]|uniref:FecR family protein n=1 Tax=Peristeroidobacter soli TaxID=2497877 RepID=UPI00101B8D57|nr:FecR domain-containing protein [Peristeroidobacter soli]
MDELADSAVIDAVAADWLARLDGETWTAEDAAAFDAWQAESLLHRVAVIRLKAIWQHADRLQALGAGVPAGAVPPPGQWRVVTAKPKTAAASPVARRLNRHQQVRRVAGVLLAVTLGFGGYLLMRSPRAYDTGVGVQQAVHLADGSQVTLNTDSRIRVRLTDGERRIDLERGEAYFEVARDASRPFVVYAGARNVVAVGTRFSVRRVKDDVRVVVTEGRVAVTEKKQFDAPAVASAPRVLLSAGNIAQAGDAGVLITATSLPEAEQALSWRGGYIVLKDALLADAVADFNRYNERPLVIADRSVGEFRIGGNLRLNNVDAFVRVLEQSYPIRAVRENDRIVLYAR